MRAVVLVVAVTWAACSGATSQQDAGTDAGHPDAGAVDSGTPDASVPKYWDGGTCAVKTDCPCFSSDDCPPTHWCHSEDSSGLSVWCIPGARGSGEAGAPCTGEADCASALCVASATSAMLCSALCDTAADCPSSLPTCQYVGFGVERSLCAPP
jgi:hypothetical protein